MKKITPVIGDTSKALEKDLGFLEPSYRDPAVGDWEEAYDNLNKYPEIGDIDDDE